MIRLGIVVVYLVNEENAPLFNLHLHQIERHTHVPYTVYGSANRLAPKFRSILEQHRVKLCDIPTTDLRGSLEHAYYLDRLIKIAVDDGATHVVTLHMDSFPVQSDWAETLIGKLSGKCAVVSIMRNAEADQKPTTACLLFHRDFFLTYRPTMHLSDAEMHSTEFERYRKLFTPEMDSGIGYGFKLFTEGLDWYPLTMSNAVEGYFPHGGLYGDLIFHLGGATWIIGNQAMTSQGIWAKVGAVPFVHKMKETVKQLLPTRARAQLAVPVRRMLISPLLEHRRKLLLDDPDTFLEYLRTGKPH